MKTSIMYLIDVHIVIKNICLLKNSRILKNSKKNQYIAKGNPLLYLLIGYIYG